MPADRRQEPDRRTEPRVPTPGRRHGDRRGYWNGCRCTPCRAANAAYQATYQHRRRHGFPILGALVNAVETWRQLRLLTKEYDTEAALAERLGIRSGRLRYGRRTIRLSTARRIRQQYQRDILDGLDSPP